MALCSRYCVGLSLLSGHLSQVFQGCSIFNFICAHVLPLGLIAIGVSVWDWPSCWLALILAMIIVDKLFCEGWPHREVFTLVGPWRLSSPPTGYVIYETNWGSLVCCQASHQLAFTFIMCSVCKILSTKPEMINYLIVINYGSKLSMQ